MTGRRSYPRGAALASLGMGLAVFLALESAIARHVGWDLFLPAAEGVFLPGRLARLGACLVAVLALGLTDKGRAILAGWDRACQKDGWRWLTAAAVTALFFAWTLRVTVLEYMTIDETSFQRAISQIPEKGLDAAVSVFTSQLLSWFFGKLYGLAPNGYWYLGFHLVVLLASLTVIGRCVLCRTCGRGWPAWAGSAVHGLLCAGLFLYCFAAIAFTVTPAVAGTAATALVLCRDENRTTAGRAASDTAGAILLCLCMLLRKETCQAVLCFWALAAAYQLVRSLLRRAGAKQIALFTGTSAAVLALVLGLGSIKLTPTDPEYNYSEHLRSRIVDYLYDDLTYDQFAQAGVPKELAVLIQGWYFMDERVNTELFSTLTNIFETDQQASLAGSSLPARAVKLVGQLAEYICEDVQMILRICVAVVLLLGCFAALGRFGRRYWPEILCALCAAGGMVLLLLYLVIGGRFLIRVFLVVTLPASVTLLMMALTVPVPGPVPYGPGKPAAGVCGALCGAALAVLCVMCAYTTPHAAEPVSRQDVFALDNAVERYAFANSDKTIITSIFDRMDLNVDPLHPQTVYPTNIFQWGYIGDLAKAPEDRLYADAFFRDDVLYMSDRFSSLVGLLQYLSVEYGPVQAALDSQLSPAVSVTDISPVRPGEDYTGWYEQNGLTYYFRNGQALTGRQTIDGKEYTFAPAGAQAQLITVTDGAIVYTTDAYSLLDGD